MNFDHYFAIGKPHAAQGQPCQDYAGSGALPGAVAYGVVADGCSGVQARTEIGAQAMVAAFERLLPAVGSRIPASDELANALMTEIRENRISGNDLDYLATLAGVVVGPDFAYAVVFGDGVIAERFADGRIRTTEVEWADNMPFYPTYRWSSAARSAFIDRLGEHAAAAVTVRTVERRGQGETLDHLSISEVTLPFAAVDHGLQFDLTSDLTDLHSVAVFSDGVSRIGGLDAAAACAELLAFRTLRGEFVKRRCLRALASWAQRGELLGDDLSMAAISLGGCAMNANDKVHVVLPGKGELLLKPQDHLATGGEGAVYVKNGMVFKLYLDPQAARARGMADKVALLAGLRHPFIVAPTDVLLDKHQELIGYYMPAASGEALMRVVTSAWRDANGFGDTQALKLVENMRIAVEAAHGLGAVMADGNETNWLADGIEPRLIDVDSWQIGRFPATAIMASIFDYHRPPPSRESDWFAWGVVSFQVLTGIHPYKGSHPDFRRGDLAARMRANASVLDPKVRLNAAVRDLAVIPTRLRDWYEATFQRAERMPPPSLMGSAVPVATPRRLRAVASAAGVLRHERYLSLPGLVRWLTREGIAILDVAGKLQAYDIVRRQRIVGVESTELARLLKQQAVMMRNASGFVWLALDGAFIRGRLVAGERDPVPTDAELPALPSVAERLLLLGGRVFALNGDQDMGMIELAIDRLGARSFLAIRQAWPVRTRSTRYFDGFGLTDCLGTPFVVMPEGADSLLIQRATGLKNYRVIGGYAGGRQCLLISAIRRADGQLYRLLLRQVGQEFEIAEATIMDAPNLNVAVTERGIALEIADDGELMVWNTSGVSARRIADPALTTDHRLLALAGGVFYLAGQDVFRLTLTT